MPRGSAKGERRGGRQKGTPNRTTTAKAAEFDKALDAAIALLPPEALNMMTPDAYHDLAWKALARAGMHQPAMVIAREVMPYRAAKLAPKQDDSGDTRGEILILGGLPDAHPHDNSDPPSDVAFRPGADLEPEGEV